MRPSVALLIAALAANALPASAGGALVDVLLDGGPGSFAYACEDVSVSPGSPARTAVDACASAHGLSLAYDSFGGDCYLVAAGGKSASTIDPSGFYLLGQYWMFRSRGVLASAGLCGTTAWDGSAFSVGYEVVAGYFGAIPNPATVAWTATHVA